MNALPDKPFVADTGRQRRVQPAADADADAVHLTVHYEEELDAAAGVGAADAGVTDAARSGAPSGKRKPGAKTPAYPIPPDPADSSPEAEGGARRRPTILGMPAMLAGIEVTLSVEIGSHRLPLRDLLAVDPGQIFQLDRMTSEPVSILVNGKPFARGEVVAMGDRFGVRLLDIVSQDFG